MNTNQYSELIRLNNLSTCQNYNDKSCCDDLILILNEQKYCVTPSGYFLVKKV